MTRRIEEERRSCYPEGFLYERRDGQKRRFGLRKRGEDRMLDSEKAELIREQKERKEVDK